MKKKNTEVGMYRKEFQDDLLKALFDAIEDASMTDRLNVVHTLSGMQTSDIDYFITPQGMIVGDLCELLMLHRKAD